jgi:hypothetical protein
MLTCCHLVHQVNRQRILTEQVESKASASVTLPSLRALCAAAESFNAFGQLRQLGPLLAPIRPRSFETGLSVPRPDRTGHVGWALSSHVDSDDLQMFAGSPVWTFS